MERTGLEPVKSPPNGDVLPIKLPPQSNRKLYQEMRNSSSFFEYLLLCRDMATIAVFGSFDGLHPGHAYLLAEAAKCGEVLVILAQDDVIRRLKHREPHEGFEMRQKALEGQPDVSRVVPSDTGEGEYLCILREKPEIVGFGYDQHALQENFLAWKEKTGYHCKVVTFSPFHPDVYKTSLLKK